MLECVNLSILKIEGLGNINSCSCQIYGDGSLLDTISMKSSSAKSICINKSLLKIILIDDPSSETISSLSFNMSIIQRPGFHWLPLFLTNENYLTSLPEEVSLPRVLIDIHPYILTPVVELTESSENFEENEADGITEDLEKAKTKNVELMEKLIELENELIKSQQNSEKEIDEISCGYLEKLSKTGFELEKTKAMHMKSAKMLKDALKENDRLKRNNEELLQENKELEDKLNRYVRLYQDIKHRESSILTVLEEKDKEIMRFSCFSRVKPRLQICTENVCDLTENSLKIHEMPFAESLELVGKIDFLNKKLVKYKCLEEIDARLNSTLKLLHLEGFASLASEALYTLGSKKVVVLLKKENLYVKAGGNIKSLESYITNNCNQDIELFLQKKKSKSSLGMHKRASTASELESVNSFICKTFDGNIKSAKSKSNTSRLVRTTLVKGFSSMSKTLSRTRRV